MDIVYFVDELDSSFVRKDILEIAKIYRTVHLFSINKLEPIQLPENVILYEEFINWRDFRPLQLLLKHSVSIIKAWINEMISARKYLPMKKSFTLFVSNVFKANQIINSLKKGNNKFDLRNSTFYSFWFYDCIYLAWLKDRRIIRKAVARAHSGDLYENHQSIRGKLLFRRYVLNNMDVVMPVSDVGNNYLKAKYPGAASRILTVRLGTDDYGLNAFTASTDFVIVSCANFRHHKRIHVLADVLCRADFPVKWFHIGNEGEGSKDPKVPEFIRNKEKLAKNYFVKYTPLGPLENGEVMKFYKNQSVNLFVSLSEVEGLPVSMMEAISMGIPILATDVGGCREIVTEQTGCLIDPQMNPEDIWGNIRKLKNSDVNTEAFRVGVRKYWEEGFSARKNYKYLEKILMDL